MKEFTVHGAKGSPEWVWFSARTGKALDKRGSKVRARRFARRVGKESIDG